MPDPVRSPSSIPEDARTALREALEDHLHVDWFSDPNDHELNAILLAVAPKLYAHWAEGRVDPVAAALFARDHARETWTEAGPRDRKRYRQRARAALGLEDRT